MFGSYGSYSSMCAASQPLDITSRSLSAHDATCAFPSWPRRDSLSESDREERPSSYLSDDDLFLSDPFDDDARSVSSSDSSGSPNNVMLSPPHVISDAELLEMERERLALQREYVRCVISEKERRRALARKQRKSGSSSSSSSSKKSPKNKMSAMAPISEE